jgi:hypothetical protein
MTYIFITPSADDLLYFQINHYTERLSAARNRNEIAFIKTRLENLLTQ